MMQIKYLSLKEHNINSSLLARHISIYVANSTIL
jgi:hypothetical protein